jgi:hypothetical protein
MIYRLSTAPAIATEDPLVFEKEAIYVDDHFIDGDGHEFSVTEDEIDHWHNTACSFIENGLEIPIPVEHTEDPEKCRGKVVGSRVGINKKGKKALYLKTKFRDLEAAKLALTSDVSIFVPNSHRDGKGRSYYRPIKHFALTNYPVIPGLEPFAPIVASLKKRKKAMKLSLATVAEKLGITVADKEDATLEAEIVSMFTELTRQLEEKDKPDPEPEPDVAASLLSVLRENREHKLDGLVTTGKITPAVCKDLKAKYCVDAPLKLSLTKKDYDDGFDVVVASLAKNDPVTSFGEKTGGQKLSHSLKPEDNPTIRDAQRRRDAALKKR